MALLLPLLCQPPSVAVCSGPVREGVGPIEGTDPISEDGVPKAGSVGAAIIEGTGPVSEDVVPKAGSVGTAIIVGTGPVNEFEGDIVECKVDITSSSTSVTTDLI